MPLVDHQSYVLAQRKPYKTELSSHSLGKNDSCNGREKDKQKGQAIEFAPWKPLGHMTTPVGGLDECWMILFLYANVCKHESQCSCLPFCNAGVASPCTWRMQVFHCFTASFWKRFVDFTGFFVNERHLGTLAREKSLVQTSLDLDLDFCGGFWE